MPRPVENPPNPWLSEDVAYLEGAAPPAALTVFEDKTRSVITTNDSPDLPFDHGVNPYRGCFHGCSYCYARPSHEYLSFGAGTDFERKLVVKPEAPMRLREAFERPSWKGKLLLFSGITDCYQPLEAAYKLTRQCLEVCAAYRNPVAIVTKGVLIERDLDVLMALHEVTHLSITISIPLWNLEASRVVEPYVASPERRLKTVAKLAAAGLDVGVNISPFIPGLSDRDLVPLLERTVEAGAI
ncbi:MAG: radical SAM protein, partial [Myxococcota bacterium]